VERLKQGPRPTASALDWAAGALGPGAREVVERPSAVARSGVDPLEADSLISAATSYTLALRLDGVDSKPAEAAFAAAGAKRSRAGEWTNYDLGAEWAVPDDPALEPLGSLGARPAVKPGSILLARSPLARGEMEKSEPPAIDAGEVAVAAECLGDVLAARLVLNNHTHLPNSGPELLAFGVSASPADLGREVLCAVGDPDPVGRAAESLGGAFASDARDGVSGEPMGELVAGSELDTYDAGGLAVARVVLDRASGTEPGFLFGAFDRGSMLTYLGMQPPPSPGVGSHA